MVAGVKDVAVAGISISADSSHPMALVVKEDDADVTEEDIIKTVNGMWIFLHYCTSRYK